MMAGAPGFEPGNGGTKNRCLTTWRRPKTWPAAAPAERRGDIVKWAGASESEQKIRAMIKAELA